MQIGDTVPDFTLKDQNREEFNLYDIKDKMVLLSFHPLAWTGICAKQMQSLETTKAELDELDVLAVGISVDSDPSKNAWAKELRIEETRFAAMTAAMLSLGERVATELNKGLLKKIFVEGDHGYIISMQAGENAVLTVSATAETKLGLLFLDMERASGKIAKILTYR